MNIKLIDGSWLLNVKDAVRDEFNYTCIAIRVDTEDTDIYEYTPKKYSGPISSIVFIEEDR